MASQWDAWLRELAKEGKLADAATVPRAFRGYGWAMDISLEGDFTGYSMVGRISYPDAGSAIATMTDLGPVLYQGNTLWRFSLSPESTAALPTGGEGDVDEFPFMLIMIPPTGEPYPLIGGLFPLLGGI